MENGSKAEYRIQVDQLRPGVFIRLERTSWFDHPFLFSNFKIKDQEQIALIKRLGIAHVICIPEKSDVLPASALAKNAEPEPAGPEKELSQEAIDHLWEIKRERARRLKEKKERIARCEKRFNACIKSFNSILSKILGGNIESLGEAVAFVGRLSDYFVADRESTLHLMNVMDKGEATYSHPMNVAVLSMMVGRETGMSADELTTLGLSALFHDIGKEQIDKRVIKKRDRTRAEEDVLRQHPVLGARLLLDVDIFPKTVARVVAQHHERMDGSGYPSGLKGEAIDRMARVVAIADAYDNHCNHAVPRESLTPYLALSYMFGQQKTVFDVEILALFIRCLGVYPPGTVVELSNGEIGMVMAVNPKNQLNPSVMLYDPAVPKKEALIVDLADEPDLRVEKSIRLAQLSREAHDYLSPRSRITYYVDPS
ncbi:MAG: HD-GYP domain-containing protein [Desulfovibrionaceae bacterium]|nr:HD-GYP domain-containing protein [Desulfovibrionaceae bacterium]